MLVAPNTTEVCRGDVDCQFDPRDDTQWCAGGAGCSLPKGFVTLGDTLQGVPIPTYDLPVIRQPQFIIEYLGQANGPGAAPPAAVDDDYDPPYAAFRITVIGWGPELVTRRVVQSHILSYF